MTKLQYPLCGPQVCLQRAACGPRASCLTCLLYMFRTSFASIFRSTINCKHIIFYTRYVDYILMIYNTKYTTPETIHQHINKTHPNLQFTHSHEHKNSISFLDLLLIRQPDKIEIDIYRKPTTTDTTMFMQGTNLLNYCCVYLGFILIYYLFNFGSF